ncbi:MAG TPA: hypothetical protein VFG73_02205 [Rhodanobacteraceae bacterium]|nr:hypothetical protein [Rhodanobacteraceae bacterium]
MARQFGTYSPVVQLGLTWEESITLADEDGTPLDLTGYDAIAQLRPDRAPKRTNAVLPPPVLQLTTAGYFAEAPSWTVVEAFSIPTPTNGNIIQQVRLEDLWVVSPNNAKTRLYWSIILVNKTTGYAIPAVEGRCTFLPARTTA